MEYQIQLIFISLNDYFMTKERMTKERPGTYYELLYYLCKRDNISPYKIINFDISFIANRPKEYRFSSMIGIIGNTIYHFEGLQKFIQTNLGDLPVTTMFDTICLLSHISLSDCSSYSQLKKVGVHKDSLGRGWYSNCDLFEIDGFYFAPDIETSRGYKEQTPTNEEILSFLNNNNSSI